MIKVCGLSRKAWPKILNKLELLPKTKQHKGKESQDLGEYLPTYLLLQKIRLNFDSIQHATKSLRPYLLSRKIDLHVLYSCNNVKHAFTRPHNSRVAFKAKEVIWYH